jgi:hypothetical protein
MKKIKKEKKKNKIKHFLCFIKSHCAAPDFEMQVDAVSKSSAINKLLRHPSLVEYDKAMLQDQVIELEKLNKT